MAYVYAPHVVTHANILHAYVVWVRAKAINVDWVFSSNFHSSLFNDK